MTLAELQAIKARVEKTICRTWRGDVDANGEMVELVEGRISADDFMRVFAEIERLHRLFDAEQWTCEAIEGASWQSLDDLMDGAPLGEAGRSIVTGWSRVADGTAEMVVDGAGKKYVKFTPEL